MQLITSLQASDGVYYGLAMFAGVAGFLGWLVDVNFIEGIFYGTAALLMGGAAVDKLFYQKKHTILLPEGGLQLSRGLINRQETIALANIQQVELIGENDVLLGNLKTFDGQNNTQKIKKLRLHLTHATKNISGNATLEFDSYDYEYTDFEKFILSFQQQHINLTNTHEEKLLVAAQQGETLLQQDKQLAKEITEALQETYRSVYQTHIVYAEQEEKEFVKEQLKNLEVLYHYTPDNKTYYYFLKDDFLPETDEADRNTAQDLLAASYANLNVVQNRMQAYKQVQEKLQKTIEKVSRQQKLQNVASKLNKLQEKNMQQVNQSQDLDFEADVFEQYHLLLQQIQKTETAEEAEFLKHTIIEFKP